AGLLEVIDLAGAQVRDDGFGVIPIRKQAGDVAHEDEAPGFESDGGVSGSNVRVAIVNFPIFATRGGADHGSDPLANAIKQRSDVHLLNLTNKAKIKWLSIVSGDLDFPALENIGAGETFCLSTERVDGGDH